MKKEVSIKLQEWTKETGLKISQENPEYLVFEVAIKVSASDTKNFNIESLKLSDFNALLEGAKDKEYPESPYRLGK